jgi:hypothetical protein
MKNANFCYRYMISVQWYFSIDIAKPCGPVALRDSCKRFATLGFFHQSIPPKDLIQGLKPFCKWPNIRRKKIENIRI